MIIYEMGKCGHLQTFNDMTLKLRKHKLQKYVKGAQGIKKGGLKLLLKYPINLKVK